VRVAMEEGRARGHGVEWKLDRSFGAYKPKGATLRRNFDFVLFGTSPLSANVVNVAGSAKREKGGGEFYLHEPRNTSHSAAVGKVVSVMMDWGTPCFARSCVPCPAKRYFDQPASRRS